MRNKTQESTLLVGTLTFLAASLFIFLVLKNSGLYPRIFGDEYTYSLYSRLIPFSESKIPGYLYLAIYRLTSHCGVDFLGCARVFNALFFVCSAPFIYLVARRVSNPVPAAWITGLSLLAPINVYTAHFMPEAFYFFGFWLFTWVILRARTHSPGDWVLAGLVFGCTALIKPHSLLFSPAVILYIVYLCGTSGRGALLLTARNIAGFVIAALAAKFLISYLIAGPAGLTLFGTSYGAIADSTTENRSYLVLLLQALQNVQGHLLAICLMLGLPIAIALGIVFKTLFDRTETGDFKKIALFSTLVVANLIAVVGLFSASVSSSGPYETVTRLHMRYYDFAFPLLLILTLAQLHLPLNGERKWRLLLGVCIAVPVLYATYTYMAPYTPNYTDSPELRGFTERKSLFYLLSSLSLLSLGVWVHSTRLAAKFFLYGFMPLAVILSSVNVTLAQRHSLVPDVADRAGTFTRQYLTEDERSKLLIVNTDLGAAYRTLFYMDNAHTSVRALEPDAVFDMQDMPASKEWVLVVGNHSIVGKNVFLLPMPGFTLARVVGPVAVDFTQGSWPGLIHRAQGLSTAESWGTWSSARLVTLEFLKPLPERFRLELLAHAFGPNVGQTFIVRVGQQSQAFTVGELDEQKVFEFNNVSGAHTLIIEVPAPTSPKQLGIADDSRTLGVGLNRLSVEPL